MNPYPILLEPILKPRVWGGHRLAKLGKALPPDAAIGESWELADLPDSIEGGRSLIVNGPLSGKSLHEALKLHRDLIMGDGKLTAEGGFPLLIKYLDADQNLSVQVHPDAAYAAKHPEAHLKSEAWVIIHAEPGAVIYKGVKPHVTAKQFAEHIHSTLVVDDLIAVPAIAGECHYLPSGTCHALGAGILVAEVQTPSDTTFRVYDWGRRGVGRSLHIEQALECIRFGQPVVREKPLPSIEVEWCTTTPLAATEYFDIERVDIRAGGSFGVETSNRPEVWMMIKGDCAIDLPPAPPHRSDPNGSVPRTHLTRGATALIPAALRGAHARFNQISSLLRITLPSPVRGMIA